MDETKLFMVVLIVLLNVVIVSGLFSAPLHVNNTILCALQGGTCVTDVSTCTGKLTYQCDDLSVGLCCMTSTNTAAYGGGASNAHYTASTSGIRGSVRAGAKSAGYFSHDDDHDYGGYGGHQSHGYGQQSHGYGQQSHGYGGHQLSQGLNLQHVNRTVLCQVTGGTCVTSTTSCAGKLKFQCQDLSTGLCCFNQTTTNTAHLTTVSSGLGYHMKLHVNKTSLCTLRGGSCITRTTSCAGRLSFTCDSLAGGLCCFNQTQGIHSGYGYDHHNTVNKTALCTLKGGVCTTTTSSCVGSVAFNCETLALCCFNSTLPKQVIFRRIPTYTPVRKPIYGRGSPRRYQRGYQGGGYPPRRHAAVQSYSIWKAMENFWKF